MQNIVSEFEVSFCLMDLILRPMDRFRLLYEIVPNITSYEKREWYIR